MNAQPTRKKTLPAHMDPDRQFDQTSLTGSTHGYRVHRDYAAHFFRWGFARNFIHNKVSVLEVGCGTDCPLIKVISAGYMDAIPKRYVGCDLNALPKAPFRKWAEYKGEFNFIKRHGELDRYGKFDLIVNFEVIEHMYPKDGLLMLKAFKAHLAPKGRIMLSTPVFDGKAAAANHLHEFTITELQALIEKAGLRVAKRYGTFASHNDLKRVATPEHLAVLKAIGEYYHHDVTACFLAPLYPDAARNNLWLLEHP